MRSDSIGLTPKSSDPESDEHLIGKESGRNRHRILSEPKSSDERIRKDLNRYYNEIQKIRSDRVGFKSLVFYTQVHAYDDRILTNMAVYTIVCNCIAM